MTDILCPKCNHPINDHHKIGCAHGAMKYAACDCELTPQDIAVHAIEQAQTAVGSKAWFAAVPEINPESL